MWTYEKLLLMGNEGMNAFYFPLSVYLYFPTLSKYYLCNKKNLRKFIYKEKNRGSDTCLNAIAFLVSMTVYLWGLWQRHESNQLKKLFILSIQENNNFSKEWVIVP